MFMRILASCAVFAAIIAGGCSRNSPEPTAPAAPPDAARGRQLFAGACAQCHGFTAAGVKGLGSNLRTSEFVASSADAQLLEMIKAGREPTADRPAMPPKGGRFDLTDADLLDIIAHIRSLAEPPG